MRDGQGKAMLFPAGARQWAGRDSNVGSLQYANVCLMPHVLRILHLFFGFFCVSFFSHTVARDAGKSVVSAGNDGLVLLWDIGKAAKDAAAAATLKKRAGTKAGPAATRQVPTLSSSKKKRGKNKKKGGGGGGGAAVEQDTADDADEAAGGTEEQDGVDDIDSSSACATVPHQLVAHPDKINWITLLQRTAASTDEGAGAGSVVAAAGLNVAVADTSNAISLYRIV